MSDSVIDLSAERRAREAAAGAITITATGSGISLLVGDATDGTEALLTEQAAERHIATMQRALEALRWSRGVVQIPLGPPGVYALVDAADSDRVLKFQWRLKVKRDQPGVYYAQRSYQSAPNVKVNEMLHTYILGVPSSQWVDHCNGSGLDNTRKNLRLCNPRQNSTNVTSSKRQKLGGFKGVTWNKAAAKWQASIGAGEIRSNGKRKQLYLGVFVDPADAARAYDDAAVEHFGEFAATNFPRTTCGHMTTSEKT